MYESTRFSESSKLKFTRCLVDNVALVHALEAIKLAGACTVSIFTLTC